jgi:hypothetical protein
MHVFFLPVARSMISVDNPSDCLKKITTNATCSTIKNDDRDEPSSFFGATDHYPTSTNRRRVGGESGTRRRVGQIYLTKLSSLLVGLNVALVYSNISLDFEL